MIGLPDKSKLEELRAQRDVAKGRFEGRLKETSAMSNVAARDAKVMAKAHPAITIGAIAGGALVLTMLLRSKKGAMLAGTALGMAKRHVARSAVAFVKQQMK